jgi:hypothetical protein
MALTCTCDGDCHSGDCCPVGLIDSESDDDDVPQACDAEVEEESDSESLTVPGAMSRFARECRVSFVDTIIESVDSVSGNQAKHGGKPARESRNSKGV